MTNIDSLLKSRDITLSTKVHLVKVMVFPAVMYRCESWTIKKAECWGIDTFELWCWRRLLRVPWTTRRSNQFILRKSVLIFFGRTDAEAETPILWLPFCEVLTHWKRPWCWEGLGAGGEGDDRGWDGWMASLTRWTWVWINSRSWWWTERPGVLQFMGSHRARHDWATELYWTEHTEVSHYWHRKLLPSLVYFLETISRFYLPNIVTWSFLYSVLLIELPYWLCLMFKRH